MIDLTKPVQLAEGLWWVGSENTYENLQCNPYLLIKDGKGILFDPGSALDGKEVLAKTLSLLSMDRLEAIVLSHQDPDLCYAVSYFEEAGFGGVLCCHERAALILKHYGFRSTFYLVNQHKYSFTMENGSSIGFIFTPYLHFPGAIMSYLPEQQALVSGDLFGSITADWHLYADDSYLDGMKAFHEVYMPSHEILKAGMESLDSYSIALICPQHGSVIRENIQKHIDTLKEMPCGLFLQPRKQSLPLDGGIRALLDQVVTRLITLHGQEAVRTAFEQGPFTINTRKKVISKTSIGESELWEQFFSYLEQKKGVGWLTSISSFVELLSNQYDLPLPLSFSTLAVKAKQEAQESAQELRETQQRLRELEESLYRDPVTKLYNNEFYLAFLQKALFQMEKTEHGLAILVLGIDNLDRINLDFESSEGDRTMRILADLLVRNVEDHVQVCRLSGGLFSLLCTSLTKPQAIERANALRNLIAAEERFIVPITVSMGLFHSDEIPPELENDSTRIISLVNQTTLFRLRLARKQGGGVLISSSESKVGSRSAFTIVLVDNPGFDRDLLTETLTKEGYRVLVCSNGLEAKRLVTEAPPDLIISELLVPKLSGLTLRKDLLARPSLGRIPFLLMSVNKQERTVSRAFELGIRHFFSRPLSLYELTGLIRLISEKGA
nr:response regulator [uncultured Sphaerochaeta sp.]